MSQTRYTISFPKSAEFEYDRSTQHYRRVDDGRGYVCCELSEHELLSAGAEITAIGPRVSDYPFGTVIKVSEAKMPYTKTDKGWSWVSGWDGKPSSYAEPFDTFDGRGYEGRVTVLFNPED